MARTVWPGQCWRGKARWAEEPWQGPAQPATLPLSRRSKERERRLLKEPWAALEWGAQGESCHGGTEGSVPTQGCA